MRGPTDHGREDGKLRMERGWANLGKLRPHTCQKRRPPGQPTEPSSSGLRLANLKEGEIGHQPPGGGGTPSPSEPRPTRFAAFQSLAPSNILIQFQIFTQRPLHCLFHFLIVFLSPHPQVCRRLNSIPLQGSDSTQPAFPSIPEFPESPGWTF